MSFVTRIETWRFIKHAKTLKNMFSRNY